MVNFMKIIQENYMDSLIQDKKHQIMVTKQKLAKLELELSNLKRKKLTVKSIREQLAEVFGK